MGISGYFKWLRTTFPGAFVDVPPGKCETFDRVYVDVNDVLHKTTRKLRGGGRGNPGPTDAAMAAGFMRELKAALAPVRARRSCMLSADGPAPLAKLREQRARRCKKGDDAELARRRPEVAAKKAKKAKRVGGKGYDSLKLTPGTAAMHVVGEAMRYFAAAQLLSTSKHAPPPGCEFEVSSPQSPGEGELKLLRRMYEHRACELGRRGQRAGGGKGGGGGAGGGAGD